MKVVTRDVPTPKKGEMLIKVAAAAINRPDVIFHVWTFFFSLLKKKRTQLSEPRKAEIERSTFGQKRDCFQKDFFQYWN